MAPVELPLPYDSAAAARHLSRADRRLARLIAAVGEPRLTLGELTSPCAALGRSILYQQLHGKAAATIHGRLLAKLPGGTLTAPGLLALPEEELRACGVSANKALALRDLAQKTLDGVVPETAALLQLDDEEIVARLTQVRGIGRWTVEMLLIFYLGRPDVLPLDDYGVRKGYARAFAKRGQDPDAMPSKAELAAHGERWRPYRSLASWYLWRATELPT